MTAHALPTAAKALNVTQTTIGAICDQFGGEVQTGPFGSQLHASDYSKSGIPVVMPQDMIAGKISCNDIARVSAAHVTRLRQHKLQVGDIVFSRRGDVTRFALITPAEEGWLCGTGSIRIRLNCDDIDTGYLRHFLKQESVGDWLVRHAKGVTMANLNTGIIRAIPLTYPVRREQRRIAAILDKSDTLRTKRKYARELLDSLAQSIFQEIFGNPIKNPMGWRERPLADFESFLTSGSRGWAKYYSQSGKAFIRIQNLQKGELSTADVQYVDAPDSAEARRTIVRGGDVLVSITADLGRTAVVPDALDGQAHINQHIALVRTKGINPTYLSMYLASPAGQLQFDALNRQGVKAGLNFDNIRGLKILEPPMALQKRYVEIREKIKDVSEAYACEAMASHALFSSLQSRAFFGQL